MLLYTSSVAARQESTTKQIGQYAKVPAQRNTCIQSLDKSALSQIGFLALSAAEMSVGDVCNQMEHVQAVIQHVDMFACAAQQSLMCAA